MYSRRVGRTISRSNEYNGIRYRDRERTFANTNTVHTLHNNIKNSFYSNENVISVNDKKEAARGKLNVEKEVKPRNQDRISARREERTFLRDSSKSISTKTFSFSASSSVSSSFRKRKTRRSWMVREGRVESRGIEDEVKRRAVYSNRSRCRRNLTLAKNNKNAKSAKGYEKDDNVKVNKMYDYSISNNSNNIAHCSYPLNYSASHAHMNNSNFYRNSSHPYYKPDYSSNVNFLKKEKKNFSDIFSEERNTKIEEEYSSSLNGNFLGRDRVRGGTARAVRGGEIERAADKANLADFGVSGAASSFKLCPNAYSSYYSSNQTFDEKTAEGAKMSLRKSKRAAAAGKLSRRLLNDEVAEFLSFNDEDARDEKALEALDEVESKIVFHKLEKKIDDLMNENKVLRELLLDDSRLLWNIQKVLKSKNCFYTANEIVKNSKNNKRKDKQLSILDESFSEEENVKTENKEELYGDRRKKQRKVSSDFFHDVCRPSIEEGDSFPDAAVLYSEDDNSNLGDHENNNNYDHPNSNSSSTNFNILPHLQDKLFLHVKSNCEANNSSIFSSISAALAHAATYTSILVHDGLYLESCYIRTEGIKLIGIGNDVKVCNYGEIAMHIFANEIEIKNINFSAQHNQNEFSTSSSIATNKAPMPLTNFCCIFIAARNVLIEACDIYTSVGHCICVQKEKILEKKQNVVTNSSSIVDGARESSREKEEKRAREEREDTEEIEECENLDKEKKRYNYVADYEKEDKESKVENTKRMKDEDVVWTLKENDDVELLNKKEAKYIHDKTRQFYENEAKLNAKTNFFLTLKNCRIHHASNCAIFISNRSHVVIDSCIIEACGMAGVEVRESSILHMYDCRIFNCSKSGVFVHQNSSAKVQHTDIHNCGMAGLEIAKSSSGVVEHSRIYHGLKAGVYVHNFAFLLLKNNLIFSNSMSNVDIRTNGFSLIYQCKIFLSRTSGVYIYSSGRCRLMKCEIYQNNRNGIEMYESDVVCNNNYIYNNQRCGIFANTACVGWLYKNDMRENGDKSVGFHSKGPQAQITYHKLLNHIDDGNHF